MCRCIAIVVAVTSTGVIVTNFHEQKQKPFTFSAPPKELLGKYHHPKNAKIIGNLSDWNVLSNFSSFRT